MSEPEPLPEPWRVERDQTCADLGHPGATYNPLLNKTWCACGQIIRDGNHFQHVTCCGGPLDRWSK